MEPTEDFYVTLPSNVKSQTSHVNTVANFVTKLPHRIRLEGEWEVGLAEISYSISWYNLSQDCRIKLCTIDDTSKKMLVKDGQTIPAGRYDNLKELTDRIKQASQNYYRDTSGRPLMLITQPNLLYDENTRRITIVHGLKTLNTEIIFLCMDRYLCMKLGINYERLKSRIKKTIAYYARAKNKGVDLTVPTVNERTTYAERPVELNAGIQSLFVYSDIVKRTIVGDITAPILRLVEVPSDAEFGKQVVLHYASPHYQPLAVKEFETIEIDIRDDVNERIAFEFGRTICKLHFRKVYSKPQILPLGK